MEPKPDDSKAPAVVDSDTSASGGEVDVDNQHVVDWDGPNDPENPMNWSTREKASIICVVTASRFMTSVASSMVSPALIEIQNDFGNTNHIVTILTVSIYMLGYAIGPLVFAPLSEVYGRSPIYHLGNVFYTAFSVGCALAPSIPVLLVFRLLAGFMGGVPASNGGGTIADVIPRHRRGLVSSISNAMLLLAPTIAPVGGGFLAEAQGWRWVFWLLAIMGGFVTVVSAVVLRETFGPVLLQRKAASIRHQTGNTLFRVRDCPYIPLTERLWEALKRPLVMLGTNPIVMIISLYLALLYGVTYLLITSIPVVFHEAYGWREGMLGLTLLGIGLGGLIALFFTGRYSDRIYVRRREKLGEGHKELTEARLFFLFPAAVTLPAGLLLYGWTAQYQVHWMAPIIGIVIFGMGTVFAFISVSTYLIDVFNKYAASAMAAAGLLRNLAGGVVPLSSSDLYDQLGYGWGNTLLGIITVVFSGGILSLWWFGARLRARCCGD